MGEKKMKNPNIFIIGEGDLFKWMVKESKINKLINLSGFYYSKNKKISAKYIKKIREKCNVDIFFLCGYRLILSDQVLKLGTFINSHGSLLPKYRGFHGNIWAMINIEKKIGFTIHKVDPEYDSGDIIYQHSVSTNNSKSYHELKLSFMKHWKKKIFLILFKFHNSLINLKRQNEINAIYVAKRNKEDTKINWDWGSVRIYYFIRALKYPITKGAFFMFKNKKYYVHEAFLTKYKPYIEISGRILKIDKSGIYIKTNNTLIGISKVFYKNAIINPNKIFTKVGTRLN
jgi:methionyl-tRNA formyltransferase